MTTTDAMTRFNRAMQDLISECEKASDYELALAFAQIKLDANRRFYQQRQNNPATVEMKKQLETDADRARVR
jgi:hypothetical protein